MDSFDNKINVVNTFNLRNESTYALSDHTCFNNTTGSDLGYRKHLRLPVSIEGLNGEAFMDCGCTFIAVSENYAKRCNLAIRDYKNDLKCAVGGGQTISLKRRVARCVIDLGELGSLDTFVFIMDPIPFGCDMILGMEFFEAVNPRINWRDHSMSMGPDGKCQFSTQTILEEIQHQERLNHYMIEEYGSPDNNTKVITAADFEKELKKAKYCSEGSFFFIINPQNDDNCSEKAQRQRDQNWEQLKDNPAREILEKYKETVFRDVVTVGHVVDDPEFQHTIELKDEDVIVNRQFRLSPDQQVAVKSWTEEMIRAGLIRSSKSPYSSPIFCIKKPVGWRIVHDYRLLNQKTKIPQEPIPRKDDIIDALQGSHWFSCMDLLSGYYQLALRESDRRLTAFSTPTGHYEYLVIAQGLAGAPATFNRFVQKIFSDLSEFCRAFFDDIYVFTRSHEISDHLVAVDKVLFRCQEKGLAIKLSKCVFVQPEIPVLGEFVGRQGVRIDPDKVTIIVSWPTPRTRKELKSFLGTIQYCAKFCKDYGKLVAPLHQLTKGKSSSGAIIFTKVELDAFNNLKQAMARSPTLALPDFSKRFGIRMDASDYAVGGVLFQIGEDSQEHPVAYTGRKMTSAEMNYPVREKELLAIIHGLRVWRPYLLDQPFTVETDHKSLEELLGQRTCTQRIARWLNLLSEFRPEFRWIPGHSNDTADGISRRVDFLPSDQPASRTTMRDLLRSIIENTTEADTIEGEEERCQLKFADVDQALMVYQLLSARDLSSGCATNYPTDKTFGPIWAEARLKEGKELSIDNKTYLVKNRLLWLSSGNPDIRDRLCVPANNELRKKVLFSEHDDPSRGHPGCFKTLAFVKSKYYWKGMDQEVKQYIKSCEKCQRNKHRQTRAPGLLNNLPVPESRWQHITMDFILSLPPCQDFNSIWVIVDRLTKRAHFIPVKMGDGESSAEACAVIFCREYQRLHGIPETIVSDRDVRFTSLFWQEFMNLQGCVHQLSSAFRPNTDGQSERTNRFIEDYLRNYVHAAQDNWVELIYTAEFAYNSRIHESIKMSPFEADLGYVPRAVPDHVFDQVIGNKGIQGAYDLGQRQERILGILKDNLLNAQRRMKQYYDKNRPIQDFEVGDRVMLSSRNLNIEHLGISACGSKKFGPLWIGPYPVLAKTSVDTYQLQMPPGLKLHPQFHTSLLKPYVTDNDSERLNKPNEGMVAAGGQDDAYLIEDIIGHRLQGKIIQYLIKWVGYPAEYNTWEPLEGIRKPASGLIKNYIEKLKLDKSQWFPDLRRSRRRPRNV